MCAEAMHAWGLPAERIVEINRGEQREMAGVSVTAIMAHHVTTAGPRRPMRSDMFSTWMASAFTTPATPSTTRTCGR